MGKMRTSKREAIRSIDHISKLTSALVRVECNKGDEKSVGTGFIVGDGTMAVTAFHVVKDADEVKVVRYHAVKDADEVNAKNYPRDIMVDAWTKGAYLVGQRKGAIESVKTEGSLLLELPKSGTEPLWQIDISILHLKETLSNILPLEFDTEPARMGEDVFIMGYPRGGIRFETYIEESHPLPLLSKSIISFAAGCGIPPVVEYYYWLDRPSFPGISGSPVLRLKTGKVIGVVSATPFMPKQIKTETGLFDVMIPDGYSIAFGARMLTESVEHSIRTEEWRKGLRE